jgi:hypothetical protein
VAVHVSDEVNGAALPRRVEDAGDRVLQAFVMIGDHQPEAAQAAGPQAAQKLRPERLGLDFADVQADHLAVSAVGDGVGDDERLGDHAAAVTDLDVLGVQPQVRVGRRQLAAAELVDMLVELGAHPADAVLAHPVDAELLDEPIDLAGADAVDVGLHHHADDRLLTAPARLKKAREVRRPRARAGDREIDLADPGLPRPLAIPVQMRHAALDTLPGPAPVSCATSASINSRTTIATASRNRSACSPFIARATTSAGVIIRSSPSWCSFSSTPGRADELGRHGGQTDLQQRLLHHFYRHDPLVDCTSATTCSGGSLPTAKTRQPTICRYGDISRVTAH